MNAELEVDGGGPREVNHNSEKTINKRRASGLLRSCIGYVKNKIVDWLWIRNLRPLIQVENNKITQDTTSSPP